MYMYTDNMLRGNVPSIWVCIFKYPKISISITCIQNGCFHTLLLAYIKMYYCIFKYPKISISITGTQKCVFPDMDYFGVVSRHQIFRLSRYMNVPCSSIYSLRSHHLLRVPGSLIGTLNQPPVTKYKT